MNTSGGEKCSNKSEARKTNVCQMRSGKPTGIGSGLASV